MDLNAKLAAANEADSQKNYTEAAKLYREILQEVPESYVGKLQLYLGVSLFNDGKFELAAEAFEKAIESKDGEVLLNSYSGRAKCFDRLHQWPEAISAFEELEKNDPKREFFKWATLAHASNQGDQYEKALDYAAKGLDEQPEDFEKFHNERIFAFFKLERPMESLPDVESMLQKKQVSELRPEQAQLYSEVLLQKGHQEMTAGDLNEAKSFFGKANDITSTPSSLFLQGLVCLRLKEDKMAEKWLLDAIKAGKDDEPDRWKHFVALGTVYMRPETAQYEKAVESFTKAMDVSPAAKNPNVCFNTGFALMKLGKPELAKEKLTFVYENDKSNWVNAALLGTIMVNEKDYQAAIDVLTHAIEASNGNADDSVYYNLAYAYMMLNHFADAEKYFKKALEKNPNNEAAKVAAVRMGEEVRKQKEEEAERVRAAEEEETRIKAEEQRQKELQEMMRKAKQKEQKEAAEKAAKEEAARVAQAEEERKIKKQEAVERRRKRLEELRVNIGGPQTNRLRRPSLDLIPTGNTGDNANKYASWYNKKIVHAPDNV